MPPAGLDDDVSQVVQSGWRHILPPKFCIGTWEEVYAASRIGQPETHRRPDDGKPLLRPHARRAKPGNAERREEISQDQWPNRKRIQSRHERRNGSRAAECEIPGPTGS